MEFFFLVAGFFVIAIVYSSVGFGGGSSYLALLALPVFALTPAIIRPTALLCNVVVVAGSSWLFVTRHRIGIKTWLPYVVLSLPCAYLAGRWPISDKFFYLLLSTTLIISSLLLWIGNSMRPFNPEQTGNPAVKSLLGGGIGFLSGLVSIGGGIFLSPILHLLGWEGAAVISGISSLFILFNSIGGLAGQITSGIGQIDIEFILPILGAVIAGGQIGSRLGSGRFDATMIRKVTSVIIFIAALTILQTRIGLF
jgi:uncharacterized membrane protein YfcA